MSKLKEKRQDHGVSVTLSLKKPEAIAENEMAVIGQNAQALFLYPTVKSGKKLEYNITGVYSLRECMQSQLTQQSYYYYITAILNCLDYCQRSGLNVNNLYLNPNNIFINYQNMPVFIYFPLTVPVFQNNVFAFFYEMNLPAIANPFVNEFDTFLKQQQAFSVDAILDFINQRVVPVPQQPASQPSAPLMTEEAPYAMQQEAVPPMQPEAVPPMHPEMVPPMQPEAVPPMQAEMVPPMQQDMTPPIPQPAVQPVEAYEPMAPVIEAAFDSENTVPFDDYIRTGDPVQIPNATTGTLTPEAAPYQAPVMPQYNPSVPVFDEQTMPLDEPEPIPAAPAATTGTLTPEAAPYQAPVIPQYNPSVPVFDELTMPLDEPEPIPAAPAATTGTLTPEAAPYQAPVTPQYNPSVPVFDEPTMPLDEPEPIPVGDETEVLDSNQYQSICSGDTVLLTPQVIQTRKVLKLFFVQLNQEIEVHKAEFTIGADPNYCDFALTNPSISRIHLFITFDGNDYYVEDKGSTNGTILNGVPLEKRKKVAISNYDNLILANEPVTVHISEEAK